MKINLINEGKKELKTGDVVFNPVFKITYLVIKNDDEYAFLNLENSKIATYFKSLDELNKENMRDNYVIVESNKVEINVDFS